MAYWPWLGASNGRRAARLLHRHHARSLGRKGRAGATRRRRPTSIPNGSRSTRRRLRFLGRAGGRAHGDGPRLSQRSRHGRRGPGGPYIYLAGGSPLHLKSVLKGSATFDALPRGVDLGGAVVAGSAAGAMVLTDPMVDPHGGALTVGLGLIDQLALRASVRRRPRRPPRPKGSAHSGYGAR